jgi:hypothetical protein
MDEFFAAVNPDTVCKLDRCFAQTGVSGDVVGRNGALPDSASEAAALPIAIRTNLSRIDGQTVPAHLAGPLINMWELFEKRPLEFAVFWQRDRAVTVTNRDENGNPFPLDDPRRIRLKYDRAATGGVLIIDFDSITIRAQQAALDGLKAQQFETDLIPTSAQPFDQDRDGVYDGIDDGTPGPITDDNPFCGSGIPGDVLQNGVQFEPRSEQEEALLAQRFPQGLPPRSPVFCRTLAELHGYTLRRADGTRAFRWHAAEGPDLDADAVPDAFDNCPGTGNYDQEDSGGLGLGSAPDGIGDACQCGDVSGKLVVTVTDVLSIHQAVLELPPFDQGVGVEQQVGSRRFIPARCDVTGNGCTANDGLRIAQALLHLGPHSSKPAPPPAR